MPRRGSSISRSSAPLAMLETVGRGRGSHGASGGVNRGRDAQESAAFAVLGSRTGDLLLITPY